jgi:outer membrane biosynthesis protein TonB
MNSAGKHAVVALLVISIAGCAEKNAKTAPPAQAQAPSLDAGKAGAMYPPPLTSPQPQTEQAPPAPAPTVANTAPPPPPPEPAVKTKKPTNSTRKTKPSAAKTPTSTTAEGGETSAATTQTPGATATMPPASPDPATDVAANAEPAAASPIGQLSTGDAAEQAQTRKETVDIITSTENGLNGIKRSLSAQEQETANQIKTFLTKAKQALSNEDLDGALTLATKAKVLLDELNKT